MLVLYPHLHAEKKDQGTLTRQRHSAWPCCIAVAMAFRSTGSATANIGTFQCHGTSARLRPPYRCKSYLVNTRHLQAWRNKEARGWANSCFARC